MQPPVARAGNNRLARELGTVQEEQDDDAAPTPRRP